MSPSPDMAHEHEHAAGWALEPWVCIPLALTALLYAVGFIRLRRYSKAPRQVRTSRAVAFFSGWSILAAALVSPFHEMAEHVFSAHMIEHEVIMAISAPLFVLARPYGVLLWSLPRTARVRLALNLHRGTLLALWRWLTRPLNATLLHAVAIWVWHLPPLFEAAVSSMTVHRWQHVSFLATALVFWYSLAPARRAGQALWYVFFTMLHTSLLGALLALAPRVLYSLQTIHAAEWGLTPLEDQQLAGMLMWVPAGTVYAGAAWLYAARWIRGGARKGIATAAPARRDLGTP